MSYTTRIEKLRKQSLTARPEINMERARLITEFYRDRLKDGVSAPVARAMAFRHILRYKKICINRGELIVGERGPFPKATSTYPEVCTHTEDDLEILEKREKISWKLQETEKEFHLREVLPFWNGRSIRKMIFDKMEKEWLDAYQAGVFTEFQEQRAPGHTVLGDKIYHRGFEDFKNDIKNTERALDRSGNSQAGPAKEQLRAMGIAADALIEYARRHAVKLEELAEEEDDGVRKNELKEMAAICRRVPRRRPRNFWEALQYYWFVHLGVITEYNTWDSFNPGRLDRHLFPFYRRGLKDGTLTEERARELLQAFWIKFNNQPAPPKVGVTAEESNTYTDFCLINLGGVTEEGKDAVNELTYIILDVIEEMRLLQPSSMVQLSVKNPDEYLGRALRIVRTGFGQPSVFNTEEIVEELLRQGKDLKDARNGGCSGCVETGAFGRESYILTGYFNLPKVLEITLNNGRDPLTGRKIGIRTGEASEYGTFQDLMEGYRKQLEYFIDVKIRGNRVIERLWAERLPAPFLSILIDGCAQSGKDYNDGGAEYNTSYIQGVGFGTLVDSFAALRKHLYRGGSIEMSRFKEALDSNFKGDELMRNRLVRMSPKYGNDDMEADDLIAPLFDIFFDAVDGKPNTRGGEHRINLLPTTCHVYFGKMTGATPDGRFSGTPFSEGISPVQGVDLNGPTAVLRSASRIDHRRTGGTLLNQKFTPQVLRGEGLKKLAALIRAYFRMGGHHIQFNVVNAGTLRKAQKNPSEYRNLIVRVAGYSDYFVDLGESLQDEIIARTEHGL